LALSVLPPANNELNKLLDASNKAARSINQPMLYVPDEEETSHLTNKKQRTRVDDEEVAPTNPSTITDCSNSFHISLAWSLSPEVMNEEALPSKNVKDILKVLSTRFDMVKVKIGNAIHSIVLSTKGSESRKGILGL